MSCVGGLDNPVRINYDIQLSCPSSKRGRRSIERGDALTYTSKSEAGKVVQFEILCALGTRCRSRGYILRHLPIVKMRQL